MCILYHLERVFGCAATDINTQPTVTQQRLTFAVKNARLLPNGCCCLSDKGNESLFRINISPPLTTIAGLKTAGQRLGLPGNRTLHQWTSSYRATLKPWLTCHQLILKRTFLPILLRQQQPSGSYLAFLSTYQSLPHHQLCIKVGGHTFEHLLQIGTKYNFFSEYFSDFAWCPTLVRQNLTVRRAARTHLLHTVP